MRLLLAFLMGHVTGDISEYQSSVLVLTDFDLHLGEISEKKNLFRKKVSCI